MFNRVRKWLLGEGVSQKNNSSLIDMVKEKDDSGYGGFVRLNNDLALFVDDYKQKDPLIMMAYAYARRIAVAGMFFQGLAGKDLFDYVYDIFKNYQASTGVSVDFQEQAAAQAVELALKYLPEMNRDHIRLMTGLAAQGYNAYGSQSGLTLENSEVLTVEACAKILDNASENSENEKAFSHVESSNTASWQEGNVRYEEKGFTVIDTHTGDILAVKLVGDQFHGLVIASDQELTLPLQPWSLNINPFQDDNCFNGSGRGPNGPWSFNIVPTTPFSTIMKNVVRR